MAEIDYKPVFRELQKEVAAILSESQYFTDRNITVLCEDSLEIEFEIKKALGQQGLVAVVNTMQASYIGHDGMVNAYQIDNLELDIVENPSVWRPYLKKNGIQDGTATDIMQMAAEILGGPQSGIFGRFNPKSIEIGEDSNLVVGKAKFQTTVRQNVEGVIPEPGQPEIPFVTRNDISGLVADVASLSNLIIGFDTEEIKQNINDLSAADSELCVRIDGLGDVYQPKGEYALTSDLAPYVLKTQLPTKTSDLINDSGFISSVLWSMVEGKPEVALIDQIPTDVSQLRNDSGYLTSVSWIQIGEKPDVALVEQIPTAVSQLRNDSNYLTSVSWNQVSDKPDVATETYVVEQVATKPSEDRVQEMIDESIAAIPTPDDKVKKLYGVNETEYVDGDRGVWELKTYPAHWSEWHALETQKNLEIRQISDGIWRWCDIDAPGVESTLAWTSYEEADSQSSLDMWDGSDIMYSCTREWIPEVSIWEKKGELALKSQVPTKTSELLNDSGFATTNMIPTVPTKTSELQNDSDFATVSQIPAVPTKVSQLVNDSGYLTAVTWNQVGEKPDVALVEQIPTSVSQLVNDSGYLTSHQSLAGYALESWVDSNFLRSVSWSQVSGRPDIPTKTSDLTNDSGFITSVSWNQVQDRPAVPTKTSDLVNDSNYLTSVTWNQVQGKPEIATEQQLGQLEQRVSLSVQNKLDRSEYDPSSIRDSTRRIDVDGTVYSAETGPGYFTDWEFSDGNAHEIAAAEVAGETVLALVDTGSQYATDPYETLEAALADLETALTLVFKDGADTISASRTWIQPATEWTAVDELAYKSDLSSTEGVTEEEVREIVEGYGYQTQTEVETAITSKGYQTEQQVRSIAAQVLPTGYVETELVGTLEDDTEVRFMILTKANQ